MEHNILMILLGIIFLIIAVRSILWKIKFIFKDDKSLDEIGKGIQAWYEYRDFKSEMRNTPKREPSPQPQDPDSLHVQRGTYEERQAIREKALARAKLSAGEVYGNGQPSLWTRENTEIMVYSRDISTMDLGSSANFPFFHKHPYGQVYWGNGLYGDEHKFVSLTFDDPLGRLIESHSNEYSLEPSYDLLISCSFIYKLDWSEGGPTISQLGAPVPTADNETPKRPWNLVARITFYEDGRPQSYQGPKHSEPIPYEYSTSDQVCLNLGELQCLWNLDSQGRISDYVMIYEGEEYHTRYLRDSEGNLKNIHAHFGTSDFEFDYSGMLLRTKDGKRKLVWN